MKQSNITKKACKTSNSSKNSAKSSKSSTCLNYFLNFSFCKAHHELESSLEQLDNKKSILEDGKDSRILVTQHYSTQVNNHYSEIKTLDNKNINKNHCNDKKYLFKMSPDLKLYNNMHILLTFNTNIFLFMFEKKGIIAKISVKLIKIDRNFSEKFSFEKPFSGIMKNDSNNQIISATNSISAENDHNLAPLRRNQKILQEIIKNFSRKIIENVPLIIDISNNEGASAVLWAYEGANVLVIEQNPLNINKLKENIMLSGEMRKIDIIHAKFEDLGEMIANLIFLQPEYSCFSEQNGEFTYVDNFSLKKNLQMNMKVNIEKCLKIAENLVILLPKCCDLNELAQIFAESFKENHMKPINYALHIEMIYVNNILDSYLVCYGNLFEMPTEEEIEFIINCIFPDANDNHYEVHNLFKNIISKIGIFKSCQTIAMVFSNYDEKKQNILEKDEDFSFLFIKAAFVLNYLKETQMNEYMERLMNLKYSCSSLSDADKNLHSFSFNPFKEIKNENLQKYQYSMDLETPNLVNKNDIKSEINEFSEKTDKSKNDMNEDGFFEKNDPMFFSPSSYPGTLNSHESSMRFKNEVDDLQTNLVLVEKEQY